MGIEKKTVTGKVDPENEALVRAVHEALVVFGGTKSSALNFLLTAVRQKVDEGVIDLRQIVAQGINSLSRKELLRPEPRRAEAEAPKKERTA